MKSKPQFEKISIYLLMAFLGFLLADLGVLLTREKMYPEPPAAAPVQQRPMATNKGGGVYPAIIARNIFNADGKMPPAIGTDPNANKPGEKVEDLPPIPTSLPIQLVGTIVHADPKRSIATLNLRTKNDQVPVKVDGIIPDNVGPVTLIERNKVIFRNQASGRLEYVEMKEDSKFNFAAGGQTPKPAAGAVTKTSETDFSIKRDDVNKLTGNLSEVLQQARAVPRMGPNGTVDCYSLVDIAAGSIYERLGLKRGDCIRSVNGERVDSPAKAMELYNALRSSASSINLGVDRGGRDEQLNYNITQ